MPAAALVTSEQYLAPSDQFDQNGNQIKGDQTIEDSILPGFSAPVSSVFELA